MESLKQKEMYTWAQTMLDFISDKKEYSDIAQTDIEEKELPEEIRGEYQSYVDSIRDKITSYVTQGVEKEAQYLKNQNRIQIFRELAKKEYDKRRDYSKTFEEYLEEYLGEIKSKEIERQAKKFLNIASLKITLKYRLEKLGINLPEKTIEFLEQCLDMNPNNRPDSFKKLINS